MTNVRLNQFIFLSQHGLFVSSIRSMNGYHEEKMFYLILDLYLPTQPLEEEPQVPEVKIHAAVSHRQTLATTRADAASGPVMCPGEHGGDRGEHGGTAGCCSK